MTRWAMAKLSVAGVRRALVPALVVLGASLAAPAGALGAPTCATYAAPINPPTTYCVSWTSTAPDAATSTITISNTTPAGDDPIALWRFTLPPGDVFLSHDSDYPWWFQSFCDINDYNLSVAGEPADRTVECETYGYPGISPGSSLSIPVSVSFGSTQPATLTSDEGTVYSGDALAQSIVSVPLEHQPSAAAPPGPSHFYAQVSDFACNPQPGFSLALNDETDPNGSYTGVSAAPFGYGEFTPVNSPNAPASTELALTPGDTYDFEAYPYQDFILLYTDPLGGSSAGGNGMAFTIPQSQSGYYGLKVLYEPPPGPRVNARNAPYLLRNPLAGAAAGSRPKLANVCFVNVSAHSSHRNVLITVADGHNRPLSNAPVVAHVTTPARWHVVLCEAAHRKHCGATLRKLRTNRHGRLRLFLSTTGLTRAVKVHVGAAGFQGLLQGEVETSIKLRPTPTTSGRRG
jgi:hypothetical protein